MRRFVSLSALILAWLFANGAVWDVVQVVAWAKMFRDYSQVMDTGAALRETFEGKRCKLCHFAQSGADAARKQLPPADASGNGDRQLLAFPSATPLVLAHPEWVWPGLEPETGRERTEPVPVPPPRRALA